MNRPLSDLPTERQNPRTLHFAESAPLDMVRQMNEENRRCAEAIDEVLPRVAEAAERVAQAFRAGGRLIYIGAGTSGRLGVLDASECPPTFGVPEGMVTAIIAGGDNALRHAAEGAEDDEAQGALELAALAPDEKDVVCGIAASGRTPYVLGALRRAREAGCATLCVTACPGGACDAMSDIALSVDTGPEAVTGSTRLKAGTAQKMLLNMLTTCAMARIGLVRGNLMINVRPTNEKLRARAADMVARLGGVSHEEGARLLARAGDVPGALALLEAEGRI